MKISEIKEAVSLEDAARTYGLSPGKNGMCLCPFHNDKKPSLKLYSERFYCFGCGANGDVVDLTEKLFGLDTVSAMKKLTADFSLTGNGNGKLTKEEKAERSRKKKEERREKKINRAFSLAMRDLHQVLKDCKTVLDDWKYGLAPENRNSDPSTWDERFVRAVTWSDHIDALLDVIDFGEDDERFELFLNREEVKKHAEQLMSERGADGSCREGTAS